MGGKASSGSYQPDNEEVRDGSVKRGFAAMEPDKQVCSRCSH